MFNTRIWLIHNINFILLLKNLSHQKSENTSLVNVSFRWYCCRWWMKYTINLSSTNCHTTGSYLKSRYIRNIKAEWRRQVQLGRNDWSFYEWNNGWDSSIIQIIQIIIFKLSIFPKMLVINLVLFKHETANECRETFKQS